MAGDAGARPRVRIRLRYNVDTGQVEEFLVDDNAPERSEDYHNKVAAAIASQLTGRPEIVDAGSIRVRQDAETPPRSDTETAGHDETPVAE